VLLSYAYILWSQAGGDNPFIFAEGHLEHQAAALALVITSLYNYDWIQQKHRL